MKDFLRKAFDVLVGEARDTEFDESRRLFLRGVGAGLVVAATPKIFVDLGQNLNRLRRPDIYQQAVRNCLEGYDPVLIPLLRRSIPQMIAFDVCGVQPMSEPSGLIFALKTPATEEARREVLRKQSDIPDLLQSVALGRKGPQISRKYSERDRTMGQLLSAVDRKILID